MPRPLLRATLASCLEKIVHKSARQLVLVDVARIWDNHAELVAQQLSQRRAVPKVRPICRARLGLAMLALAPVDPVVALRARDGRRQPYLLVWRLLVDDIGAHGLDGDGQNARLSPC